MSKAALIALLAIGLLTMAGCKGTTAGVKNIPGISDEEAFRFISAAANLTRCGDRYFRQNVRRIDELKDPTFSFATKELTQADSLNGVTWHAVVSLRATATRTYGISGDREHWDEWINNDGMLYLNEFFVKNGRFEPNSQVQATPFTCSNIPLG